MINIEKYMSLEIKKKNMKYGKKLVLTYLFLMNYERNKKLLLIAYNKTHNM